MGDIDVRKLTMVVMDEVHKQMNDIAAKQKEKIDELNAEIRKLKAMIVKHESRIRTLETKNRELEQTQQFNNNGGDHSEDMDPDEICIISKSKQIPKHTNTPTLLAQSFTTNIAKTN